MTTGDTTQTIPAGLPEGWQVRIWNQSAPPASLTIAGPAGATITLAPGEVATVQCLNGTDIRAVKSTSTLISGAGGPAPELLFDDGEDFDDNTVWDS